MPHDRNGKKVNVGDRVMVPCIVKNVTEGEEYCNITVETDEPMYPGDSKNTITFNARQVESPVCYPSAE